MDWSNNTLLLSITVPLCFCMFLKFFDCMDRRDRRGAVLSMLGAIAAAALYVVGGAAFTLYLDNWP